MSQRITNEEKKEITFLVSENEREHKFIDVLKNLQSYSSTKVS